MRSSGLQKLTDNLWVLEFPAKLMGTAIGRRSTIMRLATGDLLVHSTAPFQPDDVAVISALGPVRWMLDASCYHDTFAAEGAAAFPDARLFVPPGFAVPESACVELLTDALPEAWAAEVVIEKIEGMPRVNECAVLHRPSGTLIVADLVFNMRVERDRWTTFFFRYLAGTFGRVGMSRMFRLMIKDRAAFQRSIDRVLAWDFDRLITGHGEIVETGGKGELREAVKTALGD